LTPRVATKQETVETWFFHHQRQMSMTTRKHWNWPTSPQYSIIRLKCQQLHC